MCTAGQAFESRGKTAQQNRLSDWSAMIDRLGDFCFCAYFLF